MHVSGIRVLMHGQEAYTVVYVCHGLFEFKHVYQMIFDIFLIIMQFSDEERFEHEQFHK